MQYYTKQQLQGAGRFSSRCRVGNWNEDIELEEVMLKNYLAKKERGELKIDRFQRRMAVALTDVALTEAPADGALRFGHVVMLSNPSSETALATDLGEPENFVQGAPLAASYPVSSSRINWPCARNTFVLVKAAPGRHAKSSAFDASYDDEVVHFGQKVRLLVNPAAMGKEAGAGDAPCLYLRSEPVSTLHYAKYSHKQEVSVGAGGDYGATWQVLFPDPTKRLVSEGMPVPAGAAVVLQHASTRQDLSVEPFTVSNDFGKEIEVAAHTNASKGAVSVLEGMATGKPKALMDKASLPVNHWVFQSALPPEAAAPE